MRCGPTIVAGGCIRENSGGVDSGPITRASREGRLAVLEGGRRTIGHGRGGAGGREGRRGRGRGGRSVLRPVAGARPAAEALQNFPPGGAAREALGKIMLVMLTFTLLILGARRCEALTAEAEADRVAALPGVGAQHNLTSFAGYLPLEDEFGKHVMYWFFPATEADPSTAPVSLWTNGGPGCSGFLGLLSEQGPLRVADGGKKLVPNPDTWVRSSSMFFVEQPAGVGFSFARNEKEGYKTGNDQAAEDAYLIVQAFFKRFPEFRKNDFYLSSESWGGVYMPTFTLSIMEKNPPPSDAQHINFRGFAVGNPFTDTRGNSEASVHTFFGHSMIPRPTFDKWQARCENIAIEDFTGALATYCLDLEAEVMLQASASGPNALINPYGLDVPICMESAQSARLLDYVSEGRTRRDFGDSLEYEPCVEDWVVDYLNRDDVKAAIHARPDIEWETCASPTKVRYSTLDRLRPMQPNYEKIMAMDPAFRILVFSGDDDSVCGTWGAQKWIWDLGGTVDKHWTPYTTPDGQLAGYHANFRHKNLAFVTVHGAGHEVPQYKPAAARVVWERFLEGSWFSKTAPQAVGSAAAAAE